jgi:hypothetical protein
MAVMVKVLEISGLQKRAAILNYREIIVKRAGSVPAFVRWSGKHAAL